MTTAQASFARGDVLAGRYQVIRELGRGGMAAVYLCDDRSCGERVALKLLAFEGNDAAARHATWFRQEARALAALDHPSVVRARDFGRLPDGSLFLVMDVIRGRTLHSWKQFGPLPWEVIWTLADQILDALAHIHARGVVHGDLKPSNVVVDPGDAESGPRACLLDLGLAWLFNDHIDRRLHRETHDVPVFPVGGGTTGWVAPEQIRRATPHIGPATDLYALGCILFDAITGREVFVGSDAEVLRAHRDDPVPAPRLPPSVPRSVEPFLRQLLAKRPWHRYRFAADARAVWATFRPSGPIQWRPDLSSPSVHPELPAVRGSGRSLGSAPLQRTMAPIAPGILTLRPCPLVGREREQALLVEGMEAMNARQGASHLLVVLEGEAGVGKSRFAEWMIEHAHERGLAVPLRAHYGRTLSVSAATDGLRGAVLSHYKLVGWDRSLIEQVLRNEWDIARSDETGRKWVTAGAAWLCPPSPQEIASGAFLPPPLRGSAWRLDVARYLLTRIAGDRPLLLWLDNFHDAPPRTFESIRVLLHQMPETRVLLVATTRREALAVDRVLLEQMRAFAEAIPSLMLPLGPLSTGDMRQLLRHTLPLAPDAEAVAIERSHGNPLFALQLVHAWTHSGQLRLRDHHYHVTPSALYGRAATTAQIWDERLAILDPWLQSAAYAASALGCEVDRTVLTAFLAELRYDPDAMIDGLRSAQLLLDVGQGRLRWSHPLLQEHAFGGLVAAPEAQRVFAVASQVLASSDGDSSTLENVKEAADPDDSPTLENVKAMAEPKEAGKEVIVDPTAAR